MTLMAQAQAPSFPGAEGHGRYTTGGRGGTVIHVTNLNDSGTGSFRQAVSGDAKKIVVFDVGGVIALTKDVNIGANTTILGQTAPAPGITLRYYTVNPHGNNIVMRFIRCRLGQEKIIDAETDDSKKANADGADASTARHYTGIMIDHCSFSWSIDEVASFYDNNNFTLQWSTIGEPLVHSGHSKGPHGYGGIWGGKLASFHHNLLANIDNRAPRFNGARYDWTGYTSNKLYSQYKWKNAVQAENVDFRNCVVFNSGNGCYGGPGGGQVNMVNNYYKSGNGPSTSYITQASVANSTSSSDNQKYWTMFSRYYISGNQLNATQNADWSKVRYDNGTSTIGGVPCTPDPNHYYGDGVTYVKNSAGVDCVSMKLTEPAPTGEVTTHTATKAYDKVLDYAGASLNRDDVDARYAAETRAGKATYKGSATSYVKNGKTYSCTPQWGRIDIVSDVKGYTEATFGTGSRETGFDSDNDGIADAWETANELNPNSAADASAYTLDPKKYYTNLEVYANSLVQDIMLAGNADATSSVAEYYPAYKKADGTAVEAINTEGSEVTPGGGDTPTGSEEVVYFWEDGLAAANSVTLNDGTTIQITGNTSKTLSGGNDITVDGQSYKSIKISNGAENTVTLPAGKEALSVTFYSYVNKSTADASDRESYWANVNGTDYDATTSGGLMKAFSDVATYQTDPDVSATFPLDGATKFTFKNTGYQPCLVMKVVFGSGSTGISELRQVELPGAKSATTAVPAYNLSGQQVGAQYKGIVVRNGRKMIQR
jgi:hypothetical protein